MACASLEILEFTHEVLIGVPGQAEIQEVLRDLALVVVVQVLEDALEHVTALVSELVEQIIRVRHLLFGLLQLAVSYSV